MTDKKHHFTIFTKLFITLIVFAAAGYLFYFFKSECLKCTKPAQQDSVAAVKADTSKVCVDSTAK